MYSLLNYNELKLENFQPKSGKIDENLNREGFGVQKLPGGIVIEGLWKKNKLNGEAKITFEDCTTNISGLFDSNMIQKGIIEYESGAMAAGTFQNNDIYDYFKDVKFSFASGFIFLGIYDQNCNLVQGSLSSPSGQTLLNWQGQTMIHMIENSNQGIIIESSRLYEGQILQGKRFGQGAEYYPLGLIYNIYTQNNQQGLSKEIDFCFLNKTQYRSVSIFQNQKYLSKTKTYPNGILEKYDTKLSQRTRITFERLQMEGYVETFEIDESTKQFTKGIFYFKNIILDIMFQHKELQFTVLYKKKEFSLEQWYSSIDPDYKSMLSSTRTIEYNKDKNMKKTYKKKSTKQSTKNKTTKTQKKDKSQKQISDIKCDPKQPTNCAQIREIYEKQNKKMKIMKSDYAKLQSQIISLQNLNTLLINQTDEKNLLIEKLQKELEIQKQKNVQNFDQQFFRGSLINGLKQGWVEEQIGGEYYQGFYKNNIREGKGYLVTEKFEYKGDFQGGKFDGEGEKIYFKDKKKLKGKFMEGNFTENKIKFPNCYYKGQIVNDSMNGLGKIVFNNNVYFEGVFLQDNIVENQPSNILCFENKQYQGSFKFIDDLKMKVFQSKEGQIFVFNKEKGYVKKFLQEHQLILN